MTLFLSVAASLVAATAASSGEGRRPLPGPEEIAALPDDGGPEWNRLIFEQSPYLLQHAGNPVDWYPWGEEAFAKATAEDKPIFLSIGYSTCHWCHVMETESFEDDEVADLLNEGFVCVKLDREERPDVDQVYMSITQAMNNRGGWPMTVVMSADKRPFFTGTYFPKHGRYGRTGMMELLPELKRQWEEDRPRLLDSSAKVLARIQLSQTGPRAELLGASALDSGFLQLSRRYDRQLGGFGNAPKFPIPHNLRYLLRYWRRTGKDEARQMVETTLDALLDGSRLARPPLREDALRSGAPRHGLRRSVPGDRRPGVRPHGTGDLHLRPARHDVARGRVLLRRGRRQRGPGGEVLSLATG
jgi:hypothetical protein